MGTFWQRLTGSEKRQAIGSYSDAILSIIQSQATGASALPGATAALESASGFVSRAFASASVSSSMAGVLDPSTLGHDRAGVDPHPVSMWPLSEWIGNAVTTFPGLTPAA